MSAGKAHERIQVVIYGRTYQLVGEDGNRTRALARKVDELMRRFADGLPGAEPYQLAILSALHLADEVATARDDLESYRTRVDDSAQRLLKALETGSNGE